MGYAILRTKKLKTMAAVAGSARHTFRDTPTPNADPAMTGRNRTVGAGSTEAVMAALHRTLPAQRRSTAVLCIEYLITASPEDWKRHGGHLSDLGQAEKGGPGYFAEALKFLRQKHGAENVISSTVHLDETSPHMVVYVVPMTKDKRLSCRDFLGGAAKLRQLQTDFHSACGKPFGLERGIEGSKAKHEKIAAYYGALVAAGQAPELSKADYAAAALGIHTPAWKEALKLVNAQAAASVVSERGKKALEARNHALDKRESGIDAKASKIASEQRKLDAQRDDLAKREKALEARERALQEAELLVGRERARADSLERRLAILEASQKPHDAATPPSRRKTQIELGQQM